MYYSYSRGADVSCSRGVQRQQQPSNHGRHRQKRAPPRAPQEAFRPDPTRRINRGRYPEQADMLFVGGDRVYGPQNAPMLWRRITPEQGSVLRGIHPTNSHKKHTRLLGGLSLINTMRRRVRLCLAWVSRGPYLAAAAMVGLVVAPTAVDYCSPGGTPTNWGSTESFF